MNRSRVYRAASHSLDHVDFRPGYPERYPTKRRSIPNAMTTATCIFCGTLKFGAFVPCKGCDRIPTERDEVIRSLALTDHHFTHAELGNFGIQIQNGEQPIVDAELQSKLASEVNDDMIDTLVRMSDPAIREYYRKRERNIILAIMAIILAAIGWMLFRFAVG